MELFFRLDRYIALQWRHNGRDGVSNRQSQDCLLRRRSRIVYSGVDQEEDTKTPKLGVTGLCEGNSPVTGEFPTQMASNVENGSFDDAIMNSKAAVTTAK